MGTHDFRAFGNKIESTNRDYRAAHEAGSLSSCSITEVNTLRTVHSVDVIAEGDGYWRVEFHLQSALNRMVRNMVGSSLAVAVGHLAREEVVRLLHQEPSSATQGTPCTRWDLKARPAPPEGLTLEHVYYERH